VETETNKTAREVELRKPAAQELGRRRFSVAQLLIALGIFFTCAPFLEEIKGGDLIVSFLLSLVLLSAVLAVADRRRTLVVAILLAIPTLAARWVSHFRPDLVPPGVFLIGGLLLFIFVVAQLLRFVLRAPSVTADVLCASIAAYLMLGLIWTLAYWLVDRLTPGGPSRSTRTQGRDPSMGSMAFTLASSH